MSASEPSSDYERWVARLYQTPFFYPTDNPSLDRMKKLHELIGSPMNNPNIKVIHVAGTNGKGSVCIKIANTLQKMNCYHVVGLYSSPHTSCFRERVQVNGSLISEEETARHLEQIYQLCRQHNIAATFFEITTTLAFLSFRSHHHKDNEENKMSAVVLEVGLGGRLDATNVVENSAVSIITSIGLDHTAILGGTEDKIAREKAGIMKVGSPVLVGPQTPVEVLRQYAKDHDIKGFYTVDQLTDEQENPGGLNYDSYNTRLALAAIALLQKAGLALTDPPAKLLAEGVSSRPPCRLETICLAGKPTVVLDVAHNPAAMEALAAQLDRGKPYRFVLGMSKDKDWRGILKALFPTQGSGLAITKLHLVQAAHHKASPLKQLVQDIEESSIIPNNVMEYNLKDPSVTFQLQQAMDLAASEEIIVVCGSVFLMAEARCALGIEEARDSNFLMDISSGNKPGVLAFGNDEKFSLS